MSALLPEAVSTETLGLPKEDFSFRVNPLTEVSMAEYEAMAVSVAAMSHTAARALVHVDADGAGGEVIIKHRAVWGDTAGVAPVLSRGGAGDYTLTWAAAYNDLNPTVARQVAHAVNIEFATASLLAKGMFDVTWTANTVTVKAYDSAGTAADIDFVVAVY